MRESQIKRTTAETDINLNLKLNGKGNSNINTGCGFLDHMITLFAKHAKFDIDLVCKGDTNVDYHHTTEDIGIVLGDAIKEALGDNKGINRYGNFFLPMDETLVMSAVDISGRSFLNFDVDIPAYKVGDFDTELVKEFFLSFVRHANITLHVKLFSGTNSHHIIEAIFKSVARTLREAVAIDKDFSDEIPSTKGVI